MSEIKAKIDELSAFFKEQEALQRRKNRELQEENKFLTELLREKNQIIKEADEEIYELNNENENFRIELNNKYRKLRRSKIESQNNEQCWKDMKLIHRSSEEFWEDQRQAYEKKINNLNHQINSLQTILKNHNICNELNSISTIDSDAYLNDSDGTLTDEVDNCDEGKNEEFIKVPTSLSIERNETVNINLKVDKNNNNEKLTKMNDVRGKKIKKVDKKKPKTKYSKIVYFGYF